MTTPKVKLNETLNLLAILFVKVTLEFATVTQAIGIRVYKQDINKMYIIYI